MKSWINLVFCKVLSTQCWMRDLSSAAFAVLKSKPRRSFSSCAPESRSWWISAASSLSRSGLVLYRDAEAPAVQVPDGLPHLEIGGRLELGPLVVVHPAPNLAGLADVERDLPGPV
jgi:hypothetical protein